MEACIQDTIPSVGLLGTVAYLWLMCCHHT